MRKGVREFGHFLQHKLFWQFIAQVNQGGLTDATARSARCLTALRALPLPRIRGIFGVFIAHLVQSNTWPLKAAAELIGVARSEDEFMRFRCALICRGIGRFYRVLKEPDSLADDHLSRTEWIDGSLLEALTEALSDNGINISETIAVLQSAVPAGARLDNAGIGSVLPRLTEKYGSNAR